MLCAAFAPAVTSAQVQLKGRVVVESSRQGLNGANILVRADTTLIATAVTDGQGFFSVRLRPGTYRVTASLIGYTAEETTATLAESDVTMPAFVLKAESILLNPVEVNANARRDNARTRSQSLIAGARMAQLEQRGARITTVVRELNGVRVKEFNDRNGTPRLCIESRRPKSGLQFGNAACAFVEVVIDGVPIGGDERFFRSVNLVDYEAIEFLDGNDAYKYGSRAGQFGALVLWTRGQGPHKSADRNK